MFDNQLTKSLLHLNIHINVKFFPTLYSQGILFDFINFVICILYASIFSLNADAKVPNLAGITVEKIFGPSSATSGIHLLMILMILLCSASIHHDLIFFMLELW